MIRERERDAKKKAHIDHFAQRIFRCGQHKEQVQNES